MTVDGIELRIKRLRKGYRQYQVAAQIGIAPCRLSEIEMGRRQPSPEVLEKLLKILDGDGTDASHESRKW